MENPIFRSFRYIRNRSLLCLLAHEEIILGWPLIPTILNFLGGIVDGKNYLDQIKELIKEHSKFLNRDLSFQSLESELKDLGKKYSGTEGVSLALL